MYFSELGSASPLAWSAYPPYVMNCMFPPHQALMRANATPGILQCPQDDMSFSLQDHMSFSLDGQCSIRAKAWP